MANLDKKNVRYNVLTMLVYIIGLIMIIQLFNLQIIHGEEYLEKSNLRLTRENTIKAARGNIKDCNGNILAGTTVKYSLEIYRSKIEESVLNDTILKTINILEKNGDEYNNDFPIDIETEQYKYAEDGKIKSVLKENNLAENLSAEQFIDTYIKKYNVNGYQRKDALKIISVRYGMTKKGYSSMRGYEISSNISPNTIAEIEQKSQEFPGITIDYTPIREYKYETLLAHVLGYVGKIDSNEYKSNLGYKFNDYIGKTGIEYVCEKYLKGKDGLKQTDMSIDGSITGEYITEGAIQGNDVILTIDAKVQQATEESLKNNIAKINAGEFGEAREVKAGCAVVLNVKTGEVISMYSYPDFEPQLFVDGISTEKWNEYTEESTKALLNRCIQTAYAPGSIFKMIPAIAGLETNNITIDEKINCAGIFSKGHNPKCWYYSTYGRGHGDLTVSQAIQKSCNCYFYEVGTRIGIDNIEKYATYFGLGKKTNIELVGEIQGTLAGKKLYDRLGETWYYGNTLSAVIGQAENNFTPIQMARYIAMLTNGGKQIDITLIKSITSQSGTYIDKSEINSYMKNRLGIKDEENETLETKEENLKAVLQGMKSVTTETGGTAYSIFKDFKIEVGGKTGTAEAGEKTNAWFVGFAPYENPEIAVVVFIENGEHGSYSAEVTKDIMEAYFGLNENIEEDKVAKPYVNN